MMIKHSLFCGFYLRFKTFQQSFGQMYLRINLHNRASSPLIQVCWILAMKGFFGGWVNSNI